MTPTLMRRMASARKKRAAKLTRFWLLGGWIGAAVTLVLSLMPPTLGNDDTHIDKVTHLIGYAFLTFWWAQVVVEQRWKLALVMVLFGASIELLQGLTPDRLPDSLDALANATGVLLGWFVARISPNLPTRLAALPAARR